VWGVACGAAASGNFHTWYPFNDGSVPTSVYIEDALKGHLISQTIDELCKNTFIELR
jgi:hypothetical protein